jgi:hypothetical protein
MSKNYEQQLFIAAMLLDQLIRCMPDLRIAWKTNHQHSRLVPG